MLTPKRVIAGELLDEHDAPEAEMQRALRDLRRINRCLGGRRIYRLLLRRMIADRTAPLTVLDVGTATSDLVGRLRAFPNVRPIGLDFKIQHLLYGRRFEPWVRRITGDAYHLPLRDDAVDVVTSAHFFHHFSHDENVGILEESLRVARVGVLVNDTRRHLVPLLFVRLLSALRLVGRITRFDAPTSVLRGYTLEEARAVARDVNARSCEVVRLFPWRFGLMLWK
jgi:Methylase involved in ubiquinone/menaquinone biosynthesis